MKRLASFPGLHAQLLSLASDKHWARKTPMLEGALSQKFLSFQVRVIFI